MLAQVEPPEHVWANPLAVPLPFAPQMQKYAFYGVGVQTDVAGVLEGEASPGANGAEYSINVSATKDSGFFFGDGDYSCPVLTLGAMCQKGWKDDRRNPGRTPCTVKEYADRSEGSRLFSRKAMQSGVAETFRGGAASGDHVDLLGNHEMLKDLITIASGGSVAEHIQSSLRSFTERWADEQR